MDIQAIKDLVLKQTEHFEEYMHITNKMIFCSVDDLTQLTQDRQELCSKIDMLETEKIKLCKKAPDSKTIIATIKNTCDFSTVKEEYQPLFYSGQNMQAIINKIRRLDDQVVDRISDEIDDIEQKIKKVNTGASAKASMYFESMGIKTDRASTLGKA